MANNVTTKKDVLKEGQVEINGRVYDAEYIEKALKDSEAREQRKAISKAARKAFKAAHPEYAVELKKFRAQAKARLSK